MQTLLSADALLHGKIPQEEFHTPVKNKDKGKERDETRLLARSTALIAPSTVDKQAPIPIVAAEEDADSSSDEKGIEMAKAKYDEEDFSDDA